MYPFSYTGLRLLHDEKVRDAMEKTSVDAALAGDATFPRIDYSWMRLFLCKSYTRRSWSRKQHIPDPIDY